MFISASLCVMNSLMSTQQSKQNIQAIQAWAQSNVILMPSQKKEIAAWCEQLTLSFQQALESPLKMGLIGGTGVGKSTLINRLAGEDISVAHNERPYTNKIVMYHYKELDVSSISDNTIIPFGHDRSEISHIILFDFPDYDSHLTEHRVLVSEFSQNLDIIVWVASPEKYADQSMMSMMSTLLQSSKNYCFVVNKVDQLNEHETMQVIGHWHKLLGDSGINDAPVFAVSARFSSHTDQFELFRKWIMKKRKAHEITAIAQANIDHQIQQKNKQLTEMIDCQKIVNLVDEVYKIKDQLTSFEKSCHQNILDILTPDAQMAIYQYLSRQSRFFWPVGMAFAILSRMKQFSLEHPEKLTITDKGEMLLKTMDHQIDFLQTSSHTGKQKISLVQTYQNFMAHYQNPNQIAPLLGKMGTARTFLFGLQQGLFLLIPLIFFVLYLGGIESQHSIQWTQVLLFFFKAILRLFQPEGLIAMVSLIMIELLLSFQLASRWHRQLIKKSQILYNDLSKQLTRQLMLALFATIDPLIEWSEQAKQDCQQLNSQWTFLT